MTRLLRFVVLVFAGLSTLPGSVGGTSVSLPGYSVIRLDPDTGEVMWRFGGDLMDPDLELTEESFLVTAIQAAQARTWVLDIKTGSVVHEVIPPRDVSGAGFLLDLELEICAEPIPHNTLSKLVGLPNSGVWLGATCRLAVGDLREEAAPLIGVDPKSGKELWRIELDPVRRRPVSRIDLWPLRQGGFLVAFEPLIFLRTAKGDERVPLPKGTAPDNVLSSVILFRLTENGEVVWRTPIERSRRPGAYSERWPAIRSYRLGPDALLRWADGLYRVSLSSGRLLWYFDAGPSARVQPVGDDRRLIVVQRTAPNCEKVPADQECPW